MRNPKELHESRSIASAGGLPRKTETRFGIHKWYWTDLGQTYDMFPIVYATKEEAQSVKEKLEKDRNFHTGWFDPESEESGYLEVGPVEIEV